MDSFLNNKWIKKEDKKVLLFLNKKTAEKSAGMVYCLKADSMPPELLLLSKFPVKLTRALPFFEILCQLLWAESRKL